jgi:hypothetical protein
MSFIFLQLLLFLDFSIAHTFLIHKFVTFFLNITIYLELEETEFEIECWGAMHVTLIVVLSILAIIMNLLLVFTIFFFNDERPKATLPWASFKSYIPLLKKSIQIVIAFFLIFDPEVSVCLILDFVVK